MLEDTRTCRRTELDEGDDVDIAIDSKVPMVPGAFAVVVLEAIKHESGRGTAAQEVVVSAD